jgi:hypothetical protein
MKALVSKTSFWWKQILDLIEQMFETRLERQVGQFFPRLSSLSPRQIKRMTRWLILFFGMSTMWLWNWKLLLATVIGVGFMFLFYLLPSRKWKIYWLKWQKFFQGSNRQLSMAIGGGGIAAFSTYMAAAIWAESENHWLATAIIIQTFCTPIGLILLIKNLIGDRTKKDKSKFEEMLSDLSDREPLKRLIAIRQLTRLAKTTNLPSEYNYQLIEYFRVMLSQEREAIVRDAILESLQSWNIQELNLPENTSVPISLSLKLSEEKIYS